EYARALSGGQQKLLELARLTMLNPTVMILDEPYSGVHPNLRQVIADYIRRQRDDGRAIIIIEHDMEGLFAIADRVLFIRNRALLAEGTPSEVREDARVLEAYLGRTARTARQPDI